MSYKNFYSHRLNTNTISYLIDKKLYICVFLAFKIFVKAIEWHIRIYKFSFLIDNNIKGMDFVIYILYIPIYYIGVVQFY